MLISLDYLISKYKLQIKGVAHFGAHLGQEVHYYIKNNIDNIHLFEPQKDIFEKLIDSKKNYNQIKFYNFGLGSETSSKTIFKETKNEGQSSSLLNPKLHLELYPNIIFTDRENIKIKKYDDLNIKDVNFLNIDTQGYELEALKGCSKILKDIDYIFIEVNRDYLYENNPLVGEIDDFLLDFDLIRVKTKWVSSRIPFGDAFYIKKDLVSKREFYLSIFIKVLEKFKLYFLFITPFRSIKKISHIIKKTIKVFLKLN